MKELISLLKATMSQDMSIFRIRTKNKSKINKIILPIFMFIIQLLISVTNVINTFSKPLTAILNN